MNNLTFSSSLGTQVSTAKPAPALATQHQRARLSPIPEIEEASREQFVFGMDNLRFSANFGTQASTPKLEHHTGLKIAQEHWNS